MVNSAAVNIELWEFPLIYSVFRASGHRIRARHYSVSYITLGFPYLFICVKLSSGSGTVVQITKNKSFTKWIGWLVVYTSITNTFMIP